MMQKLKRILLVEDSALKTIPVVMLTSEALRSKSLIESYNLGVNAYIVKPVDFREFGEAIREIGVFWALINQAPPGAVPPFE